MSSQTHLYRHFDANGELLYVGISANPVQRQLGHRTNAPWFPQIAKIEISQYPNKEVAEAAEKKAIMGEQPKFNINCRVQKVLEQFRLPPEMATWLSETAEKTGKTKTRLIEEALRSKMSLKEAA